MSNVTFDSHGFVKELIRVKVPEEQAEVFAKQYSVVLTTHVATKADLEHLETRINAKFDRLFVNIVFAMLAIVGLALTAQQLIG